MALVLLGAMSLGALQVQQFQQTVDSGRHAGLRLASLRDGAERYVRDHGALLLAMDEKLRVACEHIALSRTPSAAAPLPGHCALKAGGAVNGKTLAVNAFQPSISELQALDYVALSDSLPFPHGSTIVDSHSGRIAEPRWAVSVQCIANCRPGEAATFGVMLYNTQPFFAQGDPPFGYGAQLKAALQALGPDARVSLPSDSAQVAAKLRGKDAQPVDNPLKGEGAGTGVPGVLASYQLIQGSGGSPRVACGVATGASGPGASGSMCLDGTSKPSARWDFNGQKLENVGDLGISGSAKIAGELQASGGLTVRHSTDGAGPRQHPDGATRTGTHAIVDVHGNAIVRRKLIVGADDHAYTFDPNEKEGMLVRGKLDIKDGFIDVSSMQRGGEPFDPRRDGIRIPHRSPGQACNEQERNPKTSGGNIALYRSANSAEVFVMACNGQGQWVKARGG